MIKSNKAGCSAGANRDELNNKSISIACIHWPAVMDSIDANYPAAITA